MKKIIVFIVMAMLLTGVFAGCVPTQYTKGVDIDKDYPVDVLELYDDAVVFESESRFDKIIISCGTTDDIEDIVEYFKDFYEYKKISPSSEEIDDDTYSSTFIVDGYEFEIEIEEADGKYTEDLFENIIKISSKKLEEIDSTNDTSSSSSDAEDTSQSSSSNDPAASSDDQPTASTTAEPTQQSNLSGETALTQIDSGAWYSYTVLNGDGADHYVDYTIYFEDDTTGSYHYLDNTAGEKMDYEFTYNIVNGVLVINLENNVEILYDAYYDNDQLHLINQYTGHSMYMKNWNKESGSTPNLTKFTAFGSWMTYSPDSNNVIILSLWKKGAGYVYNWMNDGASDNIMWTKDDNVVEFDVGALYSSGKLDLHHRGNVLKVTHPNGDVQYYNRITANILAGVYEVIYTNDSDISKWTATLNIDGTSTHKVTLNRMTFNYDNSNWYINPVDGMLYAFIFGDYASFYYHFSENQLNVYEPTEALEYTFDKTQ